MKIMTEHIPEQVIPAHDCVTELYKFDELDEDSNPVDIPEGAVLTDPTGKEVAA